MGIVKSIQGGIKSEKHIANAFNYCPNENKAYEISEIHLANSLEYVVREEKSKYATYWNCSEFDTQREFKLTRMAYGKDSGILCHHYVISFSPNENITPEKSHDMSIKLLEEIGKEYQAVISTHTDRKHIHTHIIINSVNMQTGQKWLDNQKTLNQIRQIHDRLCKENGLTVTVPQSKKGLSQASFAMADKGVSWKEEIAKEVKTILQISKSKADFITNLKRKGYIVKWTDCNITLQKGEHKAVRVDTLAKQFGKELTKVNIETVLFGKSETAQKRKEWSEKLKAKKVNKQRISESTVEETVERYRNFTSKQSQNNYVPMKPYQSYDNKKSNLVNLLIPLVSSPRNIGLKVVMWYALKRKRETKELERQVKYAESHRTYRQPKKTTSDVTLPTRQLGNINYFELTQMQGDNFCIKIPADKLKKLINIPFFYSASLQADGTAWLTCKEKDKNHICALLNVSAKSLQPAPNGYDVYKRLIERGTEIRYARITNAQFERLKNKNFEMSVFNKCDGKVTISYDSKNYELMKKLLIPNFYGIPYREMKALAEKSGDKLCYLMIDREDFEELKATANDIKFSAFFKEDKDKFNIAYLKKDKEQIEDIIYGKGNGMVL